MNKRRAKSSCLLLAKQQHLQTKIVGLGDTILWAMAVEKEVTNWSKGLTDMWNKINKMIDILFHISSKIKAWKTRYWLQWSYLHKRTKWKPELPIESQVKERLAEIMDVDTDVYTKAIQALLFVTKKQLFIDGNKRTSVIFANHILISHGAGLIAVPEEKGAEYKKLLIEYYETDQSEEIATFLRDECLTKLWSKNELKQSFLAVEWMRITYPSIVMNAEQTISLQWL